MARMPRLVVPGYPHHFTQRSLLLFLQQTPFEGHLYYRLIHIASNLNTG